MDRNFIIHHINSAFVPQFSLCRQKIDDAHLHVVFLVHLFSCALEKRLVLVVLKIHFFLVPSCNF